MPPVTIYTRAYCGYCARALALLKRKGVPFNEIDAGMDGQKRAEMIKRSGGGRTYPQIFIGERHIGGSDDLLELDARGALDPLLADA